MPDVHIWMSGNGINLNNKTLFLKRYPTTNVIKNLDNCSIIKASLLNSTVRVTEWED